MSQSTVYKQKIKQSIKRLDCSIMRVMHYHGKLLNLAANDEEEMMLLQERLLDFYDEYESIKRLMNVVIDKVNRRHGRGNYYLDKIKASA